MKLVDTTTLSLQALRRYPLRTSMMLLAIAIGVAAVVTLTGVGEAARRYVTGEFASLGTNLLIVLPGRSETAGAGLQGMLIGETARDLTLEDAIAIERSPRVSRIAPIVIGGGTASWRSRERDITVIGTTSSMLPIQHWEMQSGLFLPNTDMDVASPVCVLGGVVARELFGTRNPLGEWLRIGDARCRVTGILAQAGVTGAFDTDESVILPVVNTQQIFNALPTRDTINQVAQDVSDGVVQPPVVRGGGYTVSRSGQQSAYILLGNDQINITFNPLDPAAAVSGVGDALVDYMANL